MESEVCLPSVEISDSDLANLQHGEVLEVGYTEIAQSEVSDSVSECMIQEDPHAAIQANPGGETSVTTNDASNQITEAVKLGQDDEKTDKDKNNVVVQMDGENATLMDKSGVMPVENVFQMENGLGDGGYIILSGDAADREAMLAGMGSITFKSNQINYNYFGYFLSSRLQADYSHFKK
jgi:hypothetical protein